MAEIIKTKKRRICDFCGKGAEAVEFLIVSPGEYSDICNECVDVCVEIIAERRSKRAPKDDKTQAKPSA